MYGNKQSGFCRKISAEMQASVWTRKSHLPVAGYVEQPTQAFHLDGYGGRYSRQGAPL